MGFPRLKLLVIFFAAWWLSGSTALAAETGAALLKAKKDADAKGYTFITNHAEIVNKAKQEGKLRVLAEMEPPTIKAALKAFTNKYPFINLHIEEITGTDAARRNILEIKSGLAKDWDVLHLSTDFYNEYLPYLWKMDVVGMAQQGILQIPVPMVDPKHRNVVGFYSRFQVTAYNKTLVPADKLPKLWEDMLKPEFKGKKFAADIRPTEIAALVPAFGVDTARADVRPMLEETVDDRRRAAEAWERAAAGREGSGPRVLINLSAGTRARLWPDENYVAVIDHLRRREPRARFIVIAAPNEMNRGEHVAAAAGATLVRTPRLRDALGIVATADFVFTPDTSIAHAAAAFDRPCVAMYVAGSVTRWGLYPASPRARSVEHPEPTLTTLGVDRMVVAVDEVWDAAVVSRVG